MPTVFNSVGLEGGPRDCISNQFPDDTDAVAAGFWDCALSVQTTALQPVHPVAGVCT